MLKERIVEQYGPIRYTIGNGCSGGAIQQYMLTSMYPGLLDGIQPACSFVASHEHGTGLSEFLPRSWDHPGCQSWDHLRVVRRGRGCRPLPISSCPATWRHRVRSGRYV